MFEPATRGRRPLRMAIDGPAKAGKTYTALRFAHALAGPDGKIAVIDTENHTAELYLNESPDGRPWKWDGCDLKHFAPSTYQAAIEHAGRNGYKVVVIDSLSHAWQGVGGALQQVDKAAAKSGNSFSAWREVTPQHNAMIDAIIYSPCHVIVTMRTHMDYAQEKDASGKTIIRKLGLKPIQREGMEYEFDIVCDIDQDHKMTVSGSRCRAVEGKVMSFPTAEFMVPIIEWLAIGAPSSRYEMPAEPSAAPVAPAPTRFSSFYSPIPTNGQAQNGLAIDTAMRCDDLLANDIKSLARDLKWPPEKLREVLAITGANRLADLTIENATALRNRMRAKLLEVEGKAAFQ